MTNKPQVKAYIEEEIKQKIEYIAKCEKRTLSKELEYIICKYIDDFEETNGTIKANSITITNNGIGIQNIKN